MADWMRAAVDTRTSRLRMGCGVCGVELDDECLSGEALTRAVREFMTAHTSCREISATARLGRTRAR